MKLLKQLARVIPAFTFLAIAAPALSHELEIEVVGKGTATRQIPASLGIPFFSSLYTSREAVKSEITSALVEFDKLTFEFKELEHINFQPDLHMTLEGVSPSAFELDARTSALDVIAKYKCLNSGFLCAAKIEIHASSISGHGHFDYFTGNTSFHLDGDDIDVDMDGTGLLGYYFDAVGFTTITASIAQYWLNKTLQVDLFDEQTFGINAILDEASYDFLVSVGIDPHDLLENPYEGLIIDISFLEPQNAWVDSGTISIAISHRAPNPSSSVVNINNALVGDVKVPRLSWAAVPNATNYHIFRFSSKSNSWQYWATTFNTQWTDLSVMSDTLSVTDYPVPSYVGYYVVAESWQGIQSRKSPMRFFYVGDAQPGDAGGPGIAPPSLGGDN